MKTIKKLLEDRHIDINDIHQSPIRKIPFDKKVFALLHLYNINNIEFNDAVNVAISEYRYCITLKNGQVLLVLYSKEDSDNYFDTKDKISNMLSDLNANLNGK